VISSKIVSEIILHQSGSQFASGKSICRSVYYFYVKQSKPDSGEPLKPMTLAVGTDAPAFTAKDTNGKTVSLADLAGKTVVLYFYPKDDTPGCTKQACSFRDAMSEYQNKGVVVLGVSADDEASHQQFTQKYNLNFPLLVDAEKTLIKAYDVDGGGYAKRVTYIIDGNGKIIHVDSSVNTSSHASDVLAALGV
jgi:peroxiredoxin Q/BCP